MRVREAKARDKGLFRKLWRQYLDHQEKNNGTLRATKNNLNICTNLFESYVNKELKGVVLFIGQEAVLMWGETGSPFDLVLEKAANGWGTFVVEEARGKGMSRKLREEAVKRLKEMGFDTVFGTPLEGNEAAMASVENFNFKVHSKIYVLPLNEDN